MYEECCRKFVGGVVRLGESFVFMFFRIIVDGFKNKYFVSLFSFCFCYRLMILEDRRGVFIVKR